MNCAEVRKKLSRYLDQEVCPEDRKALAGHLEACRACQAELASLSRVGDLLGDALEGIEVTPFFMARLRQRLREQAQPATFVEKFRRVALAAATALGVVASLLIGNQAGRTLYRSITSAEATPEVEAADVFGLGSYSEFSDGSLSDVYYQLVAGGNGG